MKHRTYDHINGVWHEKTMEYFEEMGFFNKDVEWCVTEKVHGSNFAIYQSASAVQFAKRSAFITGDKQFCQHKRIIDNITHRCTSIWNDLLLLDGSLKELIIYGEIFGGSYQHKDVEQIRGVKRVQKGVEYHPDIKFYAFDIYIKSDLFSGFLDYDIATNLFEDAGLFHAEMIYRGTFGECKSHPDKFLTLIPEYFQLPEIQGNICEGIVLKPILPLTTEGGDRVILKSKNEKFIEKSKAPKRPRKMAPEISETARDTLYEIIPYITENRLRNVLSKHGEFTKKEFGVIIKNFKEDIFNEYENDNGMLIVEDKSDFNIIKREVQRLAVKIWKPIYMKEVQ